MDGLSVAASAITVGVIAAQLIGTIEKILNFWKSIEDAPEDFRVIRKDLELLTAIIQRVNQLQKQRTSLIIVDALQKCQQKVERLLAVVQRFESGLAADSKRKRRWSAFKSSFKANSITKIHVSLEGSKSDLLLALQVSSMLEMEDIPTHVRRIASILHDLPGSVLRELDQNNRIDPQLPVWSDTLKIPYNARSSHATNFNKSIKRFDCGSPILAKNCVSGFTKNAQENETLQSRHCTLKCGCICHKSHRYEVPRPFKELVGELFVQCPKYLNIYQRCDQGSCCRKTVFTVRAAYYFPPWLLAWQIGLIATAQSLYGFQMMLNTARIRHYRDEIFYMVYDGDLAKVKETFDTGVASPHDMTNTTHTSLLHVSSPISMIEDPKWWQQGWTNFYSLQCPTNI